MIGYLRFFGVVNAAVWFGGAVFFTLAAGPGFFSPEMIKLLGRPHAGAAAQVVIERYFMMQYWCGAIALVHLAAEVFYSGRRWQNFTLFLLSTLVAIGLFGGFWIQPKLQRLHGTMYGVRSTAAEAAAARQSFGKWHGVSQVLNLAVIAGLLVYLWQITDPSDTPRPARANKFRG